MPLEQTRPYIDFGKIFNKEENLTTEKTLILYQSCVDVYFAKKEKGKDFGVLSQSCDASYIIHNYALI